MEGARTVSRNEQAVGWVCRSDQDAIHMREGVLEQTGATVAWGYIVEGFIKKNYNNLFLCSK